MIEASVLRYIRDKQETSQLKVVSLKELRDAFGDNVAMVVHRLCKKGLVKRVLRGYYRVTEKGLELLKELEEGVEK